MARLVLPKKAKEAEEIDEEEVRARKAQEELKFMTTYHKRDDYKEKANKMLFKTEY